MQFNFSKNGLHIIENGKGTYNREGYNVLQRTFLKDYRVLVIETFAIFGKGYL